jgi:uridine kinase
MMTQLTLNEIVHLILEGENRNLFAKIIAIDGPAGSGKSTLAKRLAQSEIIQKEFEASIEVIHMDDLYDGWENALTPSLSRKLLHAIVQPVSMGKNFSFSKYDWLSRKFIDAPELRAPKLLILEGVGSAQRAVASFLDQIIWIEIDPVTGLDRVLKRDGDYLADQMALWQIREVEHFRRDNTRERASIRIDGKYFI